MPRRGPRLELFVKPDRDSENVLEMLARTWKKRFQSLEAQIVYRSADTTFKDLKSKIPAKKENRQYSDSLELARITGLPPETIGYAIHGKTKQASGSALEPERTVIYVRARRSPRRLPTEISVLVEHSPWTMNVIPFIPKKSQAVLVYRKVSARAVEQVEKDRKKDKGVWKRALVKEGVLTKGLQDKLRLGNARVKAVPDIALSAMNLEFGLNGEKARPHWRTALSGLKRRTLPTMVKDDELIRSVSDPMFKNWVSWPKKTSKRISVRVAQTFVPFQKKLGIKTEK